ncbi:hypothetical protein ScPMuIL_011072 [Solemya velum]
MYVSTSRMFYAMAAIAAAGWIVWSATHVFLTIPIRCVSTVNLNVAACRRLVDTYPKENDVMNDPALTDILATADAAKSKIVLLNSTDLFKVGEIVGLRVVIRNGRGKKREQGGDIVRLWLTTGGTKRSSMIGSVTDNRDGTYTIPVKVFIPGEFQVKAMIANSRESLRTLYRIRGVGANLQLDRGRFINGNLSEATPCNPLLSAFGGEQACDLTEINYGMPFYCGSPSSPGLSCRDWKYNEPINRSGVAISLTPMEELLLSREKFWKRLPSRIRVVVLEGWTREKLPDCQSLDKQRLWDQRPPVGFFKNGMWSNVLCDADRDRRRYKRCLEGKRVLFFGDSLSRQMFVKFGDMAGGKIVTNWTGGAWHKPLKYVNPAINLTASWVAHSMPFMSYIFISEFNKGLSSLLAEIGPREDVIILISHHTHIIPYHHSAFKERLDIYQRVIRTFLKRNPKATVFIKGMTVWNSDSVILSDSFGELFNNIIRCSLSGISQRLIYLDHMDMGIMSENKELHPPEGVVEEMVHNMLGFVC